MRRRLTLQMDEELIRFGKRWAKRRGKTMSHLVADFLVALEKLPGARELPPITRRLLGAAQGVDETSHRR